MALTAVANACDLSDAVAAGSIPAESRPPRTTSRTRPLNQELTDPILTGPTSGQGARSAADADSRLRDKISPPNAQQQPQGNANQHSTITELSGATVNDPTESIGQQSRRSLTEKRRTGSTSSRQSRQGPAMASEKPQQSGSARNPTTTTGDTKPKKHGVSRFITFLSCCGVPKGGTPVEQDDNAEAAKRADRVRPARMTQPTPAPKPDVSAAESSTADSKEPLDEKVGGLQYSSGAGVALDRKEPELTPNLHGDDAAETRHVAEAAPVSNSALAGQPSTGIRSLDQPLPPLPSQPARLNTSDILATVQKAHNSGPHNVITPTQPQDASPQVIVQAPTPVVQPEEEQLISDRTPEQQQRDTDIEMTDAGPTVPLASHEVPTATEGMSSQTVQREAASTKIDLPPPPPLADRQAQVGTIAVVPSQSNEETSLAFTPAESHKWLLPPIRPEFRGRKCLVLDLDETLVHSSFKVSKLG